MRQYGEARAEKLKKAIVSGRYSEKSEQRMEADMTADMVNKFARVDQAGKLYMQKANESYKFHHDALCQIDPQNNPRQFLKGYATCLALLDPFEVTQATIDFERKHLSLYIEKSWLQAISNRHVGNMLKRCIDRIFPNMFINTSKLQIEFAAKLTIALQNSKR